MKVEKVIKSYQFKIILLLIFCITCKAKAQLGTHINSITEWETFANSGNIKISKIGAHVAYNLSKNKESILLLKNLKTDRLSRLGVLKYRDQVIFSEDGKYLLVKDADTEFKYTDLKAMNWVRLSGVTNCMFIAKGTSILSFQSRNSSRAESYFAISVMQLKSGTKQEIAEHVTKYTYNSARNELYYVSTDTAKKNNTLWKINTSTLKREKVFNSAWNFKDLYLQGESMVVFTLASPLNSKDTVTYLLWPDRKSGSLIELKMPLTKGAKNQTLELFPDRKISYKDPNNLLVTVKPQSMNSLADSTTGLEGVRVWHWRNYTQSLRELTFKSKINSSKVPASTLFAYNASGNSIIHLSEEIGDLRNVQYSGSGDHVIYVDTEPYTSVVPNSLTDVYVTNIRTGEKTILFKRFQTYFRYGMAKLPLVQLSPDGNDLLYFKDRQWWVYNFKNKQHINLTARTKDVFWDTRYDRPDSVPPLYNGYWGREGRYVYLQAEHDVYRFERTGEGYKKLTNSDESGISFRVVGFKEGRERIIDGSKPILLSARAKESGATGYYRFSNDKLERLIYEDCLISDLSQSDCGKYYTFIKQRYNQSPALYICDKFFKNRKLVYQTNPKAKTLNLGRSELIFYSVGNKVLQGVLYYPANFDPNKTYPMVVYTYERLSQKLHHFVNPDRSSAYNTTNFTLNGYFIFQPDIVYRINDPGISASKCVIAGVEQALKNHAIDKERVGLMGHSWGGYQAGFIISQTNLFKAAVAGAPLTDLISMYLGIRWDTDLSSSFTLFEQGQARFSGPVYDHKDAYIRNSTVYQAKGIHTPLLIEVGTKDGVVDGYQGLELFNTLRRMQKPCFLLSYRDEGHNLKKPENEMDYATKQMEFFDHYLKGHAIPKWMEHTD